LQHLHHNAIDAPATRSRLRLPAAGRMRPITRLRRSPIPRRRSTPVRTRRQGLPTTSPAPCSASGPQHRSSERWASSMPSRPGARSSSPDRGRVARTGAWAVSQPPSLDLNTLGGILGIITGALGVPMCSPAVCDRCKKITWTGCGQHVEQALAGVPPENRCTCPVEPASTAGRARARATEKMGARR
jgi:hypothetical protein